MTGDLQVSFLNILSRAPHATCQDFVAVLAILLFHCRPGPHLSLPGCLDFCTGFSHSTCKAKLGHRVAGSLKSLWFSSEPSIDSELWFSSVKRSKSDGIYKCRNAHAPSVLLVKLPSRQALPTPAYWIQEHYIARIVFRSRRRRSGVLTRSSCWSCCHRFFYLAVVSLIGG